MGGAGRVEVGEDEVQFRLGGKGFWRLGREFVSSVESTENATDAHHGCWSFRELAMWVGLRLIY